MPQDEIAGPVLANSPTVLISPIVSWHLLRRWRNNEGI